MLIWRVEHEEPKYDGFGPYASFSGGWPVHHPPSKDFGYHHRELAEYLDCPDDDVFYACESLEMLATWWEGYYDTLLAGGFAIRVYDVPSNDIVFGGHQVAFRRTRRCSLSVAEALHHPRSH